MFLDLGSQVEHIHDPRDPDQAHALPPSDVGLIGSLAGFEERLLLDGFAEELDHLGCPGLLGRFGLAPARRDGGHDPVGGHPARQGADVAVLGTAWMWMRNGSAASSELVNPAPRSACGSTARLRS